MIANQIIRDNNSYDEKVKASKLLATSVNKDGWTTIFIFPDGSQIKQVQMPAACEEETYIEVLNIMGNEIIKVLQDGFDALESTTDSDLDFEDEDEEREFAPMQYAARKIMQAICMLQGGDCK